MTERYPRILVVDDDADVLRQIEESLKVLNGGTEVHTAESFKDGLERVESEECDVVVLDLQDDTPAGGGIDSDAGNRVAQAIRRRRFVPIVFYTAHPANAADTDGPFITVVPKDEGVTTLRATVKEMLDTGLPRATRAVDEHVAAVRRDFLWEFTSQEWRELSKTMDEKDLGYLLARRLAASLSMNGIESVGSGLRQLMTQGAAPAGAHPHFFYVMPPVVKNLRFGDVLKDDRTYWVVLTASCDLVQGRGRTAKAEKVLLGKCKSVRRQAEYKKAKEGGSERGLEDLLKNRTPAGRQENRLFFLPPALDVPALLLDLQELRSESLAETKRLKRLASMDSPYAELLTTQVSRYYGRIGAPNLDIAEISGRLLA